jgi:hypothetical protein
MTPPLSLPLPRKGGGNERAVAASLKEERSMHAAVSRARMVTTKTPIRLGIANISRLPIMLSMARSRAM